MPRTVDGKMLCRVDGDLANEGLEDERGPELPRGGPDRLGRDAGRFAQEIVADLQGLVRTHAEVTIEVRAANAEGFPDTVDSTR